MANILILAPPGIMEFEGQGVEVMRTLSNYLVYLRSRKRDRRHCCLHNTPIGMNQAGMDRADTQTERRVGIPALQQVGSRVAAERQASTMETGCLY